MQPAARRSPLRRGEPRLSRDRLVWLTVRSAHRGETGTLPSSRPTALEFQRYISAGWAPPRGSAAPPAKASAPGSAPSCLS